MEREMIAQYLSDALGNMEPWTKKAEARKQRMHEALVAEIDRSLADSIVRPAIVSDRALQYRIAVLVHEAAATALAAIEDLTVVYNRYGVMQTVVAGIITAEKVAAYYAALAKWQERYGDE